MWTILKHYGIQVIGFCSLYAIFPIFQFMAYNLWSELYRYENNLLLACNLDINLWGQLSCLLLLLIVIFPFLFKLLNRAVLVLLFDMLLLLAFWGWFVLVGFITLFCESGFEYLSIAIYLLVIIFTMLLFLFLAVVRYKIDDYIAFNKSVFDFHKMLYLASHRGLSLDRQVDGFWISFLTILLPIIVFLTLTLDLIDDLGLINPDKMLIVYGFFFISFGGFMVFFLGFIQLYLIYHVVIQSIKSGRPMRIKELVSRA